jgi:dienelactone hydrolase
LLAWLRAAGAGPVGVFGVSLGGHVAAMLAGLDSDLHCVVAGVPTADLSTMLADTMRAHWGEEAIAASHVLDEAPRTLSRLVSPLTFAPRLPVDRRFLYAAVGDRLVTPQQALALWQHWERPAILWLQGGHIANNVGASRRFVADALIASGVTGPRREGA